MLLTSCRRGPLNSGGSEDVILFSLNAPHTQRKLIVTKNVPSCFYEHLYNLTSSSVLVQIFVSVLENASKFLGRSARISVPHL